MAVQEHPPPGGHGRPEDEDEDEDEDKRFRGCWPLTKYNHNNAVGFIHSTIEGLASSVWGDTVLTTYVYMIMGGSNTAAGVVDGVDGAWGLVSIAVALPVGRAADKSRRKSRIIAVGGLLTPLAVASSAFAVIYGVQRAEDAELPR